MPTNSRRQYLELLDKVEKPIEQEFLEWVRVAVGAATIAEVEAHLREIDVDQVLRDLTVVSGGLSGTTEAIRTAYLQGGRFEAPAARITFDIRNVRAENWIRNNSSEFVTRIIESQREAIRTTLESGMRLGRNPRQTALDIVGRVGKTGRRSGGIVGLASNQAQYVANAREQLSSGDPSQMRQYFSRTRRDGRFDGIVKRAIESGKPVAAADIDRIVGRYADRLLFTRGESIGRTESIAALNAGREEAVLQAIDEGVISHEHTTGIWDATGDARTRPSHAYMEGQRRREGEPFRSSTGALMLFPGDTSLGAGAEDVISCRCFKRIEYDYIGQAAKVA